MPSFYHPHLQILRPLQALPQGLQSRARALFLADAGARVFDPEVQVALQSNGPDAQLAALHSRIARLKAARVSVERMANNVAPKHALLDAAFTSTPPPTAKEEKKRAAKRAKK